MKITESQLRKIITESIRKVLKEESVFPSMIKTIMQACHVDETEAQEYLNNAAREIHSWMDQGVDPSRQTGYGGNYYEEEMQGLGLDSDYLMDFAQYCMETYKPQTTNENTPMSEEETISVLEEHENELLSPFRLYVDRQMSVIQLYYTSINKADNALQQDLARKYKQIKKELPEWCPVIVNKPRIENNPNGTQDLIIDIEYDENGAKNFGETLNETKKDKTTKISESKLRKMIRESVRKILRESADPLSQDYRPEDDPREDDDDAVYDPYEETLYRKETAERLPDGWKRIKNDYYYGGYVYIDQDGNEYERDEYGKFWPVEEPEY